MIQANELRIGNWLYVYGNTINTYQTSKPKQVNIEFLKAINVENEERPNGILTWFNPIPLTPEILEKCGFEYWTLDHFCKDPNDAYWVHNKMKFAINNIKWTVQKLDVKINYLHQLQNLYFALTGEELLINM